MLANSDRPNLRARAWAALDARAILFSGLPDSGLLKLIRAADQRHLPMVLMEAAAELMRRIGDRSPDEAFIRRVADLKALLIELEEGATGGKS